MNAWKIWVLLFLGALCLIGIGWAFMNQKIVLDQKYFVGVRDCDLDKKICVTPLSISQDRTNAVLLVNNFDSNRTCLQEIKDGGIVPLQFGDCRDGLDWNGERSGNGLVFP